MSNEFTPSRFVLQYDWELSIADKCESFWAGLKEPGKAGVYFNIFSATVDTTSCQTSAELPSSDPSFSATYNHGTRSLLVSNESAKERTTFVAPLSGADSIHTKSVYSMDVTAGGLGVSADSVGNLIVWETESFATRRSLIGHLSDVYSCRFFPSGLVVLSGGADMQLKIWSVEAGECVKTLIGHKRAVTDVGFIDRGRNVVSCSKDGTARLWDCGSGACLAELNADCGQMNALSLVARPTTSATSASGDLAVGTENKMLAVACESGSLAAFSLRDKAQIFRVKCESAANAVGFIDENTLVCGTENGFVSVLDVRKPNCFIWVIQEDRGAVYSFCTAGKGFWTSFSDGSVSYRNCDQNQSSRPSELELSGADCDPVSRVCTDERYLYTSCRDGKIRKYAVEQSIHERA